MTLKEQAISGVKWTSVSSIFLIFIQLLKISVLARFLDKPDFGLMALVVFMLGFMNLFMDMGLTSAILHKQNITKKEYASLYWLNFGFSIILYLIILLITPAVSNFYTEKELLKLLPLMGLSLIISAFGRQFKTIEQKKLHFRFIALVNITSCIISMVAAIIFAVKDFGVYALVYSALIQYSISNLAFLVHGTIKWGLYLHFNYHETKTFLRIGIFQVGGQLVNYFNRDLDILIIGKFFGTEILGGYSLAKQLVFRPAQIINPIVTKVASPVLARFQDSIDLLRKNYLKLINIVATINIPVYLIIIVFASPIVTILYGYGFENIVNLVRILSVYMMFRALGNPIGSLVIATGRTDLGFYWNVVTLIIIPAAILIGVQFSIEWVAKSITLAMIILFIPGWSFFMKRLLKVKLTEYIINLIPNYKIIISFIINRKL